MMDEVHVVITDTATLKRLERIAELENRFAWELAETAVEEAALEYFRHRKDDPARAAE